MEITADNLTKVLKSSKNIILHGAPGTGKTHLAKQIAEHMDAEYEIVQFHPSYDYTDFVEGLRPVNENGQVVFKRKDGIFKEFCKKAISFLDFDAIQKSDESDEFEYTDEEIKKFTELHDRLKEIEKKKNIADMLSDINEKYDTEDIKGLLTNYNINDELKQFFLDLNEFYISIYDAKDTENTFIKTYDKNYEMNFGEFIYWNTQNHKQGVSEGWRLLKNKKIVFGRNYNTCGSKDNDDICDELIIAYNNKLSYKDRQFQRIIADTIINFFSQKQDGIVSIFDKFTKSKNFVFIIDEINRGEISKIFGELFYLIDPDKRGEKHWLKTQYQNLIDDKDEFKKYGGFYIPENVYIIATMNDIDRSVEPIDFAFRRRFTWINVKASKTQETILKELNEIDENNKIDENLKNAAKDKMDALNTVISTIDGLDENYHIGASYFLKLKNFTDEQVEDMKNKLNKYERSYTYGNDVTEESKEIYDAKFLLLWEYHLEPLLREYLCGRPSSEIENNMKELKKAYGYNRERKLKNA